MATAEIFGKKYTTHSAYPRMLGYGITITMHVINAIQMTNIFKGEALEDEAVKQFADNQLKFLTVWNVYMQIFYAALGLSCDVLSMANQGKDNTLAKTLKGIRDLVFSSIVWPFAFVVSVVFWTAYSYDHSFILPPSVDKALTATNNHIIHTAVVPVVLWEIVFRPRKVPDSHILNLVVLNAYTATYLIVLISSYIETGAWVYPFLNLLYGTIYLYIFFTISVIIAQISYALQWYLTGRFWGNIDKLKKVA